MIGDKVITVVLPAYNAAKTLEVTFRQIPPLVDHVILVDDQSSDQTVALAQSLGIEHVITHEKNRGYGGNQKTCYTQAMELKSDIIVMVHPDYQYTPKLIESMCYIIANDVYPVVLGSRILGKGAIKGGMPRYKYIANRFLTLVQNLILNEKLSEYHTGLRAYSSDVLRAIRYTDNSDDFIFDNQVLAQIFAAGYEIAEVTCPTRYFAEASSINFRRSVRYGLGVLGVSLQYRMHKWGLARIGYLQGNNSNR